MLRIGVLGAGHLGKIHLRLLQASPHFELIGFHDPEKVLASQVSNELGYRAFDDLDSLIEVVDAVDIVTPTLSHYECAKAAILKKKHVFIEKPITKTLEEALYLQELLIQKNVKGQVGHIERFNPAFKSVQALIDTPMFIEAHRLAEFNPRGTDVPVVLDLMIHDIDIILHVVNANIRSIHASGVAVISQSPDIANARIVFENGCVANLTASRISMKNMRKSRFFQRDAYISVDFLEKAVEVVKMKDAPSQAGAYDMILQNAEGDKKQIYFENPVIEENNALLDELESFEKAIREDTETAVPLNDGARALDVAYRIIEAFEDAQ